ncbi:hypothetical protein P43SY_008992 [Pythium insidiosum]|uniref:Actin-like protein n=1 Tax=Pythium insidiosum TaxID=114742 RepID=A0AAD5LWN6_PYTIN|nr:hypothetical protein P43SY_008992 [Pythium insidiosum]
MFCGDDVEAVVGDVGTSLSKFGLAGEDTPKIVLPSAVGCKGSAAKTSDTDATAAAAAYVVGDHLASRPVDLRFPVETGAVTDWDAMEQLWAHAFDRLHVDPKQHPVITSAPSSFADAERMAAAARESEKYMELMFEKMDVPCFYRAHDAVLDAFAFGRSSALIVEIGAAATRVVPIVDGYVLQRPVQHSAIGGDRLSEYLERLVRQRHRADVQPRCCVTRKVNASGKLEIVPRPDVASMPASFLRYTTTELFNDIRHVACVTSPSSLSDEQLEAVAQDDRVRYELPDGHVLTLGRERYEVAEHLLHPTAETPKCKGLPQMIYDAVHQCDADLRRDMLGNIILCGGGSLLPGLTERLHTEVAGLVPSAFKLRFTAVTSVERQFSCFIGGSVLASLGSFQQLWVSRREYDEVGAAQLCADRLQL